MKLVFFRNKYGKRLPYFNEKAYFRQFISAITAIYCQKWLKFAGVQSITLIVG